MTKNLFSISFNEELIRKEFSYYLFNIDMKL